MRRYKFEWDPRKAFANERKHDVSFDEAKTVFADFLAVERSDSDHPAAEDRLIIIGVSERQRLIVVAYPLRDHETIRLISARQATRRERLSYEEQVTGS